MSLLPFEEQQAVFEAISQHPALTEHDIFHIPSLQRVDELDEAAFQPWLDGIIGHRETVYGELERLHSQKYTFVPEYIMGFRADGTRIVWDIPGGYDKGCNLYTPHQLEGLSMVTPTRYGLEKSELVLGPASNIPGYDATARYYEELGVKTEDGWENVRQQTIVADVSTAEVDPDITFWGLRGMTDVGFSGVTDDHRRFVAQAQVLGGGASSKGFDIFDLLPQAALARKIASQVLGHNNFLLPIAVGDMERQDELRPLIAGQNEISSSPPAAIDHIHGDLEFTQAERSRRLEIYGNTIVTGEPYVLHDLMTPPAPEGSVVLIDSESMMEGIQPVHLADAAAVLTRGYTAMGNIRISRAANYDHVGIVARSLFDQRPSDFVYFKLPHINPDTDQWRAWDSLKTADTITVATNGQDIKIRGNQPNQVAL